MQRVTFTVTAERGARRWVLQCVEHPGALSEVTRLDQAEDMIREAIAWVAQIPAESFDIDVQPRISDEAAHHLARRDALRQEAAAANSAAAAAWRAAARSLAERDRLTVRDIGRILDISHQRAAQLLDRSAM